MKRIFLIASIALLALASCSGPSADKDSDVINFWKLKQKTYSNLPEKFFQSLVYVPLEESGEFTVKFVDKIVCHGDDLYFYDETHDMIVAFAGGTPRMAFDRQGESEEEYDELDDFDIGPEGDIWILNDSDALMHYSSDGTFISSLPLPFSATYIKCVSDRRLMFALASWNDEDYAGRKVLVADIVENLGNPDSGNTTCDAELRPVADLLDYDEHVDQNFEFLSFGFADCGNSVIYHVPICEDVCQISPDGEIERTWKFDFGPKTVPNTLRWNIYNNLYKYVSYSLLVKSMYVDDNVIVGCVRDAGEFRDFIIDRRSKKLYLQDDEHKCLQFMGVSGGKIIFFYDGEDGVWPEWFPEDVRQGDPSGKVVISLDADSVADVISSR